MRRRMDFQLPLPLFMEPEVTHAYRPTNTGADRRLEQKPAQVSTRQLLADVPAAAQLLLSFSRVDHPVEECTSGGGVLSAQCEALRQAALSPYQEALDASSVGTGQRQFACDMRLLSSEGA